MASNSKNALVPVHIVKAQSMASSVTSTPTNVQYLDNVTYFATWTGTPTGTFNVQASLDYQPGSGGTVLNAGTWSNLSLSASVAAAGAADTALFDLNELPFPWIRLVYTAVSGSGTLDLWVSGKAV